VNLGSETMTTPATELFFATSSAKSQRPLPFVFCNTVVVWHISAKNLNNRTIMPSHKDNQTERTPGWYPGVRPVFTLGSASTCTVSTNLTLLLHTKSSKVKQHLVVTVLSAPSNPTSSWGRRAQTNSRSGDNAGGLQNLPRVSEVLKSVKRESLKGWTWDDEIRRRIKNFS